MSCPIPCGDPEHVFVSKVAICKPSKGIQFHYVGTVICHLGEQRPFRKEDYFPKGRGVLWSASVRPVNVLDMKDVDRMHYDRE